MGEDYFVSNKDLLGATPALSIFPVGGKGFESHSIGNRLDGR